MKKIFLLAALCLGMLIIPTSGAEAAPFLATFRTTTASESVTLPLISGYTYDFTVDWGDGSAVSTITAHDDPDRVHNYAAAGDYQVIINGTLPYLHFQDDLAIVSIDDAGDVGFGTGVSNFAYMFYGANNLTDLALFDTSSGTTFWAAFSETALTSIPLFDTGSATNFTRIFRDTPLESLPMLNTSKVEVFDSAFSGNKFTTIPSLDLSSGQEFQSMFSNVPLTSFPLLDTSNGTNFRYMFSNTKLTTIPLIDTSNGTNFDAMFYNTSTLTSIPLLNTSKGITFLRTFNNTGLTTIPLLDTSSGANFVWMFSGSKISSIPAINTSKGTTFGGMFNYTPNLTSIPLLDTSNGTNFDGMFEGAPLLTSVPLLDTSSGTVFTRMFDGSPNITAGALSGTRYDINYSSKKMDVAALRDIFNNLGTAVGSPTVNVSGNPGTGDLSAADYAITEGKGWTVLPALPTNDPFLASVSATVIRSMDFTLPLVEGYTYDFVVDWGDGTSDTITSYDDPDRSHTYLTEADGFNDPFFEISITGTMPMWSFGTIPGLHWNIRSINNAGDVGFGVGVTDFSRMFRDCLYLSSVPLFDTSAGTNFSRMFDHTAVNDTRIPQFNTSNGTDFSYMFANNGLLFKVPVLDTANGTDFSGMFSRAAHLAGAFTVPLINTSNGTNFSGMFGGSNISSMPLLDTGNGIYFSGMFYGTDRLSTIPVLDTSNGINFDTMFWNSEGITSVPLFDTSSGTSFSRMFEGAKNLTSIPAFNTINGTNFSKMFYGLPGLTSIGYMDTSSGTDFTEMFLYDRGLSQGALDGTRYSIDYSNTNLDLVELQKTIVGLGIADNSGGQQTINLTGVPGAAVLTQADYDIAEAKGWIIIPAYGGSCNDGIQNQDEEGIDCGGICVNGYTELQKINASDGVIGDNFGGGLSASPTRLVVGQWNDDDFKKVYTFSWNGSSWVEEGSMQPSDAVAGSHHGFANATDTSGNRVIVGSPRGYQGETNAAYIYEWDGSNWGNEKKIVIPDAGIFGHSVAIDGDIAVIGDYSYNSSAGAAFVYRWNGSDWIQEKELTKGTNFAKSVGVSGNRIIVGATGSISVYEWNGIDWIESTTLTASNYAPNSYFGNQVKIHGDTIASSAYAPADSLYIYDWDGSSWNENKFTPSEASGSAWGLALYDDTAVVAFPQMDNNSGGSFVYKKTNGVWGGGEQKLHAADSGSLSFVGMSAAVSEDRILLGSALKDTVLGSVYYFGPVAGGGACSTGDPFLATFRTTGANESITLPLPETDGTLGASFVYDFTVDWGDGSPTSDITTFDDADRIHTYTTSGDYQISVSGTMPMLNFYDVSASKDKIISIDNAGDVGFGSGVTSFHNMFYSTRNLVSVASFDTSSGTDFSGMFFGAFSLTTVPLFDTSNGTDFSSMFNSTTSLTTIPLLVTSNGTNFSTMFNNASSLTTIPLLDTGRGTNFLAMFIGTNLSTIPALDTSEGEVFALMFSSSAVTSIPYIDTSNGLGFLSMFMDTQLTSVPQLNVSKARNSEAPGGHAGDGLNNMFGSVTTLTQGTLSGSTLNISYLNNQLDTVELRDIITNLGNADNTYSQQALDITGNPGVSGLDAADYAIAEGKGWVVIPAFVVPETCDDLIQNQDETGVDCGGSSCIACESTALASNFPPSGIDLDASNMEISVQNSQHTSVQCAGQPLSSTPNPISLADLGFEEGMAEVSDFGDFGTNSCFQQAGEYTVKPNIYDKAGNFRDVAAINFTVTSASPSSLESTLVPTCTDTIANGADACTMDIVLRDRFDNEIEQDIDDLNLFSLITTDLTDANEGIPFRSGLRIGASDFSPANQTSFDWRMNNHPSLNITALAPSIERIDVPDLTNVHLSAVVNKDMEMTITNVPSIEDDGTLGARNITFAPIPVALNFGSPVEVVPSFDPETFSWTDEIDIYTTLEYPSVVAGISSANIDTTLQSVSSHLFGDPANTDPVTGEIIKSNLADQPYPFSSNTANPPAEMITRAMYANSPYDTPDNVSLLARASYQIDNFDVNFVAGGIGTPMLEAIQASGINPVDVLGFNTANIGFLNIGVSIEGFVMGEEDQMHLVGGDSSGSGITRIGSVHSGDIREGIIKNAYALVRNAKNVVSTEGIFNFDSFTDKQNVVVVDLSDITDPALAVVNISGALPGGKNTLIVLNGNVVIDGDLSYGSEAQDSFGLILLRDQAGSYPERGNIFVRSNVLNITGSLFADGGFFSNDSNDLTTGNAGVRNNQLLLKGALLSRNTIGGSRLGNYFTPWEATGNQAVSRRYDLHEVRRYVPGSGTCAPVGGPCDTNDSAFVLRLDQKSSLLPPPAFRN